MNEYKVSIIIPMFNAEKYIDKCLKSVLGQTYRNIEVILIDDFSTDSTLKICEEYLEKDDRINILVNHKNHGVSETRNIALKVASGKYVIFIDSDDWIDKDFVEVMINNSKEINEMVCVSYFLEYKNGSFSNSKKKEILYYDFQDGMNNIFRTDLYRGFLWNKIFLLDNIKKFELKFSNNIKICEDLEFVYNYIEKTKSYIKFINVPKYHYRQRSNSAFNKFDTYKHLDMLTVYDKIMQHNKSENIINDYININLNIRAKAIKCKEYKLANLCANNIDKYKKNLVFKNWKQRLKFFMLKIFPTFFYVVKNLKYKIEKRVYFD